MTEAPNAYDPKLDRIDPVTSIPFIATHLLVGLVFVTGVSWQLALLCLASYYIRMFFVTAGYHRYFSHRTFKTGRVFQFIMAFMAESSAQKGVLWWAAHHRHHHRYSDQEQDVHSPTRRGFWWSHIGWIVARRYDQTNYDAVKDFARFPELKWINEHFLVPPMLGLVIMYAIGGLPWVVWGGIVPTVLLWHGTFTINSLSHIFGKRRYLTTDTSRNNFLFALITCGEGWHNNHHFHMSSVNQGWHWWQVDVTYYVLKALSWVGIVSDLRTVKPEVRDSHLAYTAEQKAELKRQEQERFGSRAPTPVRPPIQTPESILATIIPSPQPAPAKS
ncbi:MAG: acyl-CoA desaturase [Archangium sp.]